MSVTSIVRVELAEVAEELAETGEDLPLYICAERMAKAHFQEVTGMQAAVSSAEVSIEGGQFQFASFYLTAIRVVGDG